LTPESAKLHCRKRASNYSSALACTRFQVFAIDQRNLSSIIFDDACVLQPQRDLCNGLSPHVKQHANPFLRDKHLIAAESIRGTRQKIAKALLDAVVLVAHPEL
jgi:hypothetical protein